MEVAIADITLALLVDLAQSLGALVEVAGLLRANLIVGLELMQTVALLLWWSL